MGIFDSLLGGKNSKLDRWALFMRLSEVVTQADGKIDKSEVSFSTEFLKSKGLSEHDILEVSKKSAQLTDPLSKISKLSMEERSQLLDYLIKLAGADGEFHAAEYLSILIIVFSLGIDPQGYTNIILKRDDINSKELEEAYQKLVNKSNDSNWPNLSFKK